MAEGLLRIKAGERIEVFSAGTRPKGLNPLAVEAMKEIGIDISGHQSKDVDSFRNEKFDWVITVCNRAKEECPVFPGAKSIHWDIPDPDDPHSFRRVRDDLSFRIHEFLKGLVP